MGIFDKAKELLGQHDEQVVAAIEKAGDLVDEKTGGKFEGQVDQAQDLLQEKTGEGDTSA